ncbi:carbohydrate ABC transporter permease [Deinococcus humi]|uniref:Putative chitobiose transport system permease protein n=1 Tax=Deinococcus humi TaxID=662880 RepID=A0A7W8NFL2_9DEIO|nr:sugar ABC transporter permease [Deinococcus humi]MBB5363840.1 putative chitobiose transport system permease protein [Deinococcus humi]GGO31787.1 lactose ABC transporter permease [Deinococcus humi]
MARSQPLGSKAPRSSSPRPRPRGSLRDTLLSYAFLAPALILLTLFTFYPLAYGSYLGFTEYGGARFAQGLAPKWIGLENFRTLAADPLFLTALGNSVKYLVIVPVLQLASLSVAVLVNKNLPGMAFFRAAYYIPVVTSISLAAVMWDWVYNKEGTLNWALGAVHLIAQGNFFGWLNNENTAFWAVMLVTFWRGFGYYMVLYLAGLQSIPAELEEAAVLDGASAWKRFWNITVPLMKPTILLCSLLSTIAALRVLEEVLVLTNGGPLNSTYTALMYVYSKAFQGFNFDYGLASAAGLVVAVVALLLSVANFRLFRESDGGET